jgi:hypothetical protein
VDQHGFGQCLGAIEVKAGEIPSRLAASTYAASGSRLAPPLWPLILNMQNTDAGQPAFVAALASEGSRNSGHLRQVRRAKVFKEGERCLASQLAPIDSETGDELGGGFMERPPLEHLVHAVQGCERATPQEAYQTMPADSAAAGS